MRYLASIDWARVLRQFWFGGWGFDRLYQLVIVCPFKFVARINKNDVVDDGYQGIAMLSKSLHRVASASQNGRMRWYAASMSFGTVVIIALGLLS